MKCPHCWQPVDEFATKCQHCTGDIDPVQNALSQGLAYAIIYGGIIFFVLWVILSVVGRFTRLFN